MTTLSCVVGLSGVVLCVVGYRELRLSCVAYGQEGHDEGEHAGGRGVRPKVLAFLPQVIGCDGNLGTKRVLFLSQVAEVEGEAGEKDSRVQRGTRLLSMWRAAPRGLSGVRPSARYLCDATRKDAELVAAMLEGKLPHHKLEAELENQTNGPLRAAKLRRTFLEASTAATGNPLPFQGLPVDQFDASSFYAKVLGANAENVVGYLPLPVGVIGPLVVDGDPLYVPLATTEGALIASANRGARAVYAAGGVTSVLLDEGMTRAPLVGCVDLKQSAELKAFCEDPAHIEEIREVFSSTSRFGKLLDIKVSVAGRHAYLRFKCSTGDAMGMNMVGKGVNTVMGWLVEKFPGSELLALSGNLCCDKKPSAVNWIEGRGKSVAAEALIPAKAVSSILKSDAERIAMVNTNKNLIGSALAGSIGGMNAHASNMVTALYLACGQDPAQNVGSSNCITTAEAVPNSDGSHDLRIACTMPSVECGTVGGGTGLPAQSACLKMLGVHGSGDIPGEKARKLGRIVAATVLCGELSLLAALSSNHLISAHLALNRRPSK